LVALGDAGTGLTLLEQASRIDDRLLGQVFALASDRQRAAFLRTLQFHQVALLSLVWRHRAGSPEAARAALALALRRQGVTAEALALKRDAVLGGAYPRLKPRLRELSELRMRIARRALAGPGPEGRQVHEQQLAEWHRRREEL